MPVSSNKILPPPVRIGLVGTGFIARGMLRMIDAADDMEAVKVLTRRPSGTISGRMGDLATSSVDELVESCDLVVEACGDVPQAAASIDAAMRARRPVVTIGTEFHVTIGSWFADKGMITEAQGDQPGSLAALREECLAMGFEPLVYGNIKGFLNHHPTPEDMDFWSAKQGISLTQVTSFTDGTKMQMEQAFAANAFGATLARPGMLGPAGLDTREGGDALGAVAREAGAPIADYLLNGKLPAGVFVVATHPSEDPAVLRYLKMGEGPYYTLLRPYHLCHLEALLTIRRAAAGGPPLLNNTTSPTVTVRAIAKRDLVPGTRIERAIGGFDLRGEAIRMADAPDAAPIGLLEGAVIRRPLSDGDTVTLDDVDLPDNLAARVWHEMRAIGRA